MLETNVYVGLIFWTMKKVLAIPISQCYVETVSWQCFWNMLYLFNNLYGYCESDVWLLQKIRHESSEHVDASGQISYDRLCIQIVDITHHHNSLNILIEQTSFMFLFVFSTCDNFELEHIVTPTPFLYFLFSPLLVTMSAQLSCCLMVAVYVSMYIL